MKLLAHVNIANRVFENSLKNKYKSLCYIKLIKEDKYLLLIYLETLDCNLSNTEYLILSNNLNNVL